MGIVSKIIGICRSPVSVRNDSVYFQVERNLKTGISSLTVSVSAPSEHIEQLEALLKTHCYTLLADYAASGLQNQQPAAVINLLKRQ